jgi:RNA polymerase sigma factor (sigma-70 family)
MKADEPRLDDWTPCGIFLPPAISLRSLFPCCLRLQPIAFRMSEKWVTRQSLLVRARGRSDDEAWQDFADYYRDFIAILLRRFRVTPHDQDDLNQEILLKIWKNLDKYDPHHNPFRTWLNCLIRNKIIDFNRKRSRIDKHETVLTDHDDEPFDIGVSEDEMAKVFDKEWRAYLTNRALQNIESNFSGKAIEVFKLSLGSKSVPAIAEEQGIAESSVYKLRKRVEERLRLEVRRLKSEVEL